MISFEPNRRCGDCTSGESGFIGLCSIVGTSGMLAIAIFSDFGLREGSMGSPQPVCHASRGASAIRQGFPGSSAPIVFTDPPPQVKPASAPAANSDALPSLPRSEAITQSQRAAAMRAATAYNVDMRNKQALDRHAAVE